jgi:hypothetical protein
MVKRRIVLSPQIPFEPHQSCLVFFVHAANGSENQPDLPAYLLTKQIGTEGGLLALGMLRLRQVNA